MSGTQISKMAVTSNWSFGTKVQEDKNYKTSALI